MEPGKEISFFDQVEFVRSFCYLGDRLNASSGSEAVVPARTQIGWLNLENEGSYFMGKSFC